MLHFILVYKAVNSTYKLKSSLADLGGDLCCRRNKRYEFSVGYLNIVATTVRQEMALVYEDIIQFKKHKETL